MTQNTTFITPKTFNFQKNKKLEKLKDIRIAVKILSLQLIKLAFDRKLDHDFIHHKLKYIQDIIALQFSRLYFFTLSKFVTVIKSTTKNEDKIKNYYIKRKEICGIVKTFFYFTNAYVVLTTIDGTLKGWVSGGSAGFDKMITRRVPKLPVVLGTRMTNLIPKEGFQIIKIQHTGPSTRYRNRVVATVRRRQWKRKYRVVCIEESYAPAFNGCRLKRLKRKKRR